MKQRATDFKVRFVLLLFSLFILISFILIDRFYFSQKSKNVALKNALQKTTEREKVFQAFLSSSSNTLTSIKDSSLFTEFLQTQLQSKETILDLFTTIAKSNEDFMQLRYIDKNGLESIRIDRKKEGGDVFIINDTRLQNKAKRYYFAESKHKELEKVWFSALDLNMEQGKVETPLKPTLRAILPVGQNGSFQGILIINYFMEGFLEKFMNIPLYDTILFNEKGFPLIHYDDSKSWGYYKNEQFKISDQYKNLTPDIMNQKLYQTSSYVVRKLDVPVTDGVYILLQLKQEYLENEISKQNMQYFTVFLIVLAFAFISIYFISKIVRKILQDLDKSQDLNHKLNEVNSQLNTILDTTIDGIALIDLNANFIFFNKSYQTMTGYSKEELLQKSCLELTKPSDRPMTQKKIQQVIEKGYINNYEKRCINKNNEEFDTLMSMVLMPDKKRMLIVVKDVTEIKAQEKKLQNQEEILLQQSKMAAMGEMLENIAHQWRQPLSLITVSASGIKVKKEYEILDDDDLDKSLDAIVQYAEHLSKTIDNFRDFFKQDKEQSSFTISSLIDKCLFLVSSKFQNRNIEVTINVNNEVITTLKNELVQVVVNILNNARDELEKYDKGTPRLIFIDVSSNEHNVIIEISDNAGGIPKENLTKVFEQYFTTKQDSDGTGIGLFMSKNIVTKHLQGELSVENKEVSYLEETFTGASFKITLPYQIDFVKMEE